ncbi:SIR2 family protein [Colwelliaceae bacterium BS250]
MSRADDLRPDPELPEEIKSAALDGKLVLFIGAGASMLLGLPSWGQLAHQALKSLNDERFINFAELNQLLQLDPKKQLSIAKVIADENNFDLNLAQYLKSKKSSKIYEYLNSIGAVCVTTNYDHELSPITDEEGDGSKPIESIKRISGANEFKTALLRYPGTVIHLHGDMDNQNEMIVTTRDYLQHYDNENVKYFLGELFEQYTVFFVGYGLEEAEILEHVLRRGGVTNEGDGAQKRRFAIQGFFNSDQPLYDQLRKYYQKSFGVKLIGFTRDYNDYVQLEKIIKDWAENIDVKPPALIDAQDEIDAIVGDDND